ncbi:MAG: hypothetical protein HKP38_03355 [Croceitalea sp.]|nr:hypothetical protein [Croceitalea sp.]MBT8239382.1 hypothetical protein [Croceitalea sp.]NNC34425.1 hypothetical protein [Croceitalea sp.]NNL08239.1 hypothetical protein [Croceitalea sp.]NNM18453.1 hypothetical protein [Croceitalea sp.]
MMDELELLKKDWQKKEGQLPKLSYDQIYRMIWKKSSSIVKWIFYISIAEFLFWIALSFIPTNTDELQGEGAAFLRGLENVLEVASYLVIIYFIYKFYQNYRKISTTDSARDLMKKIIRVRKTVMLYVWFNLALFAISMIVVLLEVLILDPPQALTEKISAADSNIVAWLLVGLFFMATILFFGLILGLFYRLIYGILLKRLNLNYRELKKLEI